MRRLAVQIELRKLASLMQTEPEALAFMERLPVAELRSLRQALWLQRLRRSHPHLRPLLGLARLLPAPLAAWCCEHLLGTSLVAGLAGELPAHQAVAIARLLSPARLADVAAQLDPRCARDLIQLLPLPTVLAAAAELLRRGYHLTLGRFADHLGDEALSAVLASIEDDADLLQAALFVDSRFRLDHTLRLLPAARRRRLLRPTDATDERLRQLMFLLASVGPALRSELAALLLDDAALLGRLLELTQAGEDWPDMLPVWLGLEESAQRALLALPQWRQRPELLASLIAATGAGELWAGLLPFCALMDADMQAQCAQRLATQAGVVEHLSSAALVGEHWPIWLHLLAQMPPPLQQEFATLLQRYGTQDAGLEARVRRQAQALPALSALWLAAMD